MRTQPSVAALLALAWWFAITAVAHALPTRLVMEPRQETISDSYGRGVAVRGDVNGDGYDDLLVGASSATTGDGRAYLYFGSASPDTTADLVFMEPSAVEFGTSVDMSDVNGDGHDDCVVASPFDSRVYVYYGGVAPNAVADKVFQGQAGEQFGYSVACAGDVNGDGYDDLITGAWGNDAGGSNAGQAYIHLGGASPDTTVDLVLTHGGIDDNFGYAVSGAGDTNGDGYDDFLVGGVGTNRAYLYFGGATLNATSDLSFPGEAAGDFMGLSVSGAGDVNRDGYDDVIVGAPYNDAGGIIAGRAYVFYMGPSMDAVADLVFTGGADGHEFGTSVSDAGDVNGDGAPDLVAGGNFYWNAVYYGGVNADDEPDMILPHNGRSPMLLIAVAGGGDLDGDGRDEVVAGFPNSGSAPVYGISSLRIVTPDGGETWAEGTPATVRWDGAGLVDVDFSADAGATWMTLRAGVGGEARNALAVTVPAGRTELAMVRVRESGVPMHAGNHDVSTGPFRVVEGAHPSAQALDRVMDGEAGGDRLGYATAWAGDVNGDGFDDFLVGASSNDAAGLNFGRVYLHLGGASADAVPDLIMNGTASNEFFGDALAGLGDINRDGYDDFAVGAYGNDVAGLDAGRAYVYLGGATPDGAADLVINGPTSSDRFGTSIAGAGDVNGDGYDDFVVGAPAGGALFATGVAMLYLGGATPDGAADLTLNGATASDAYGTAVAGAGDVNRDGFDDFLVGAPAAGLFDVGLAYLYLGSAAPNGTAALVFTGQTSSAALGSALSRAGDVNGDGFDDFLIGANLDDTPSANAGRVYLFHGSSLPDNVPDLIVDGITGEALGTSVSGGGDVNGDGFADIACGARLNDENGTDAGRVLVLLGGPSMDHRADWILEGEAAGDEFGVSVTLGGDAAGDGFDDLVAGGWLNDGAAASAGRAYLHDFDRYVVTSPVPGAVWAVGATKGVSWLGAEPADLWLSVNGGAAWSLLASGAGGEEVNGFAFTVPHQPTRFAQVRVTPHDPGVTGSGRSDSLFTIQSSIMLLDFVAESHPEGGTMLAWQTDPGPADLAGYRVERSDGGDAAWRTVLELTRETSHHDRDAARGARYRLYGVNGLGAELLLGETSPAQAALLAAWPSPYRGGDLTIHFVAAAAPGEPGSSAEVVLYDVAGRVVRTLARGPHAAGAHRVAWDGRDDEGRIVANGIYFLQAHTAGRSAEAKIIVAR